MVDFKLGAITDAKLALAISRTLPLYPLTWELETKDGKTTLSVYADWMKRPSS